VLYGGGFAGVVDLAATNASGFTASGGAAADWSGTSLALLPDANGDGWGDLVLGAPNTDHLFRGNSGSAYMLWGYGSSRFTYPRVLASTVSRPIAPLAPAAVVRTGVPTFSVSPALPAGLALDSSTGVISGAPSAIQEQPSVITLTMTDFAGSVSAPVLLRVAPLPGACANLRTGSPQPDKLAGTSGGDRLQGAGGGDDETGLGGDDCLLGDAGADTLDGADGSDQLHGGAEPDTLDGDAGNDALFGDAGQDHLAGGAGNDLEHGGGGYDELRGEAGNDKLWGEADSDRLEGGAGNDRIDGGSSPDQLFGGPGDDVLLGGAGNDIISDSGGRNRVDAGSGDDVVNVRNGRRDTVSCGKGRDRAVVDRGDKVRSCERVKRGRR
jgi:hypothetical protein